MTGSDRSKPPTRGGCLDYPVTQVHTSKGRVNMLKRVLSRGRLARTERSFRGLYTWVPRG
jgi:hypothetical protein